eukprot:CAMPEP_0206034816 /NCGR_PEP_ID=MMETSP1466-20131121/1642_1 /ASSEMBLY_ACC=CAM_ASM_001126 /TAXON_ID=44452 /ORGANISM="Pavlova gyrans, Strain CCMP608" /LENGTH=41 /DNA_ID= /DNA_START= /DNA_END= /DNA_ORIENTATION=
MCQNTASGPHVSRATILEHLHANVDCAHLDIPATSATASTS